MHSVDCTPGMLCASVKTLSVQLTGARRVNRSGATGHNRGAVCTCAADIAVMSSDKRTAWQTRKVLDEMLQDLLPRSWLLSCEALQ